MWVYNRRDKEGVEVFSAGYFDPEDVFKVDSEWATRKEAADRVHFLNGGDQIDTHAVTKVYHITTSGVLTVINQTVLVDWLLLTVSNPGTNWTFSVRNKAATPNMVIAPILLNVPGSDVTGQVFNPNPERYLLMTGGIDIVTAGTPGIIDVWIGYNPDI